MISTWVGLRYYLAHNYSAASRQNRDSVEMDPNFAAAHLVLGEDYVQAGLHNEAVNELTRAASLSGVQLTVYGAGRDRPCGCQAGNAKHSKSRTNWKRTRRSVTSRRMALLRFSRR